MIVKPQEQILIGKLGAIPSAIVAIFICNDGVWPIERPAECLVGVGLLAVYAFALSRNWLRASLAVLSFVTINMIAFTYGDSALLLHGLLALLLLYQGVIGMYRLFM